ncbi:MAG: hypothetical protein VB876_17490 [Pirellulales bacterium]
MKMFLASLTGTAVLLSMTAQDVQAHSTFKKAFQARYELKTVSCSACHAKKDEIAPAQVAEYTKNTKKFRNEFGKRFEVLLKGTDVTKQYYEAKEKAADEADSAKKEAIKSAVNAVLTKEIIEALKKFEEMKSPGGETWKAFIKAGKVSGTKLQD